MTTPALGPRQSAALRRLQWARQIEAADDKVMTSLARNGLVAGRPIAGGKAEWRSTYDGSVAIGALVDDRNDPEPEQEAA